MESESTKEGISKIKTGFLPFFVKVCVFLTASPGLPHVEGPRYAAAPGLNLPQQLPNNIYNFKGFRTRYALAYNTYQNQ